LEKATVDVAGLLQVRFLSSAGISKWITGFIAGSRDLEFPWISIRFVPDHLSTLSKHLIHVNAAIGNWVLYMREETRVLTRLGRPMDGFAYRCPTTGQSVQAWSDDVERESTEHKQSYVGNCCPACSKFHFVNLKTREVLGYENK
jgi:hypothetical protein